MPLLWGHLHFHLGPGLTRRGTANRYVPAAARQLIGLDLTELPSARRWQSSPCQAVKPRPQPPTHRPSDESVSAEPDLGYGCRGTWKPYPYDAGRSPPGQRSLSIEPPAAARQLIGPTSIASTIRSPGWKSSGPDRGLSTTPNTADASAPRPFHRLAIGLATLSLRDRARCTLGP